MEPVRHPWRRSSISRRTTRAGGSGAASNRASSSRSGHGNGMPSSRTTPAPSSTVPIDRGCPRSSRVATACRQPLGRRRGACPRRESPTDRTRPRGRQHTGLEPEDRIRSTRIRTSAAVAISNRPPSSPPSVGSCNALAPSSTAVGQPRRARSPGRSSASRASCTIPSSRPAEPIGAGASDHRRALDRRGPGLDQSRRRGRSPSSSRSARAR